MLEFGTDKPDLRNPLRIIDLTDFFQRCTFKPFHGKTVRAINVPKKLSKGQHEKLLKYAQSIGMGGLGYLEVLDDMTYKGPIDKFIPDDMKSEIAELANLYAFFSIISSLAPISLRSCPAKEAASSSTSAMKKIVSPAFRFASSAISLFISS